VPELNLEEDEVSYLLGIKGLISQRANEEINGVVDTHRKYRATLKGKSGEYVLYEVEI